MKERVSRMPKLIVTSPVQVVEYVEIDGWEYKHVVDEDVGLYDVILITESECSFVERGGYYNVVATNGIEKSPIIIDEDGDSLDLSNTGVKYEIYREVENQR